MPVQQASPRLPHASHVPIAQRAPAAVQVMMPPPPVRPPVPNAPPVPPVRPPAPVAPPPSAIVPPQQVCPTAPHGAPADVAHEPFEQVPVVPAPMHAEPAPTHVPATQQPPDSQLFAAQQGRPATPHVVAPAPPPPDRPAAPPPPLPPQPRPKPSAAAMMMAIDEPADDDPFRFMAAPKIV